MTEAGMRHNTRILGALAICMLLVGCVDVPDFRRGERFSNPFNQSSGLSSGPNPFGDVRSVDPAPTPSASAAESACLDAGRAAGFDVQGIVGTREVLGSGGLPQSRDVMLRVQRGSQSVEVRCSYAYMNGTAQIMTL